MGGLNVQIGGTGQDAVEPPTSSKTGFTWFYMVLHGFATVLAWFCHGFCHVVPLTSLSQHCNILLVQLCFFPACICQEQTTINLARRGSLAHAMPSFLRRYIQSKMCQNVWANKSGRNPYKYHMLSQIFHIIYLPYSIFEHPNTIQIFGQIHIIYPLVN